MNRRRFLTCAAAVPLTAAASWMAPKRRLTRRGRRSAPPGPAPREKDPGSGGTSSHAVSLFLCGDVMTGRGVDQILPYPGDPRLLETYMRSAAGYVELAEAENGPIPHPVGWSYVWGDALRELDRVSPDARIINLETSVTTSDRHWPGKSVHYRMNPRNVACLSAAGIDCCVLANNHVLDWGVRGLRETLDTLVSAGMRTAGAGLDIQAAAAPAILSSGEGRRVLVFGLGSVTSGIPDDWAARANRPGVNLLSDLSRSAARRIALQVRAVKSDGDIVVASIHWGANWGYDVSTRQRDFAHRLIEEAGVDVVHGHSSHHFMGIEVHRGRPILYGCGDFLNDYEGISGRDEYRSDLALMYFPVLDASGRGLTRFTLTPMRIERFRLNRPSTHDVEWVRERLSRESERFSTWVESGPDDELILRWA